MLFVIFLSSISLGPVNYLEALLRRKSRGIVAQLEWLNLEFLKSVTKMEFQEGKRLPGRVHREESVSNA
jgi:hypothetical protein